MGIFNIIALLLFVITVCMIYHKKRVSSTRVSITRWPVVGMLPDFFQKSGHIHDFMTDVLREHGGTFEVKSPWFVGSDMLVTSDPANVNHILSRNFSNYPKGPKFRAIFEILGDGVFNVDSELWSLHRRATLSLLSHPRFNALLETCVSEKVENGLLPVLDLHARRGDHFDMQRVFERFTFDLIVLVLLDTDPRTLALGFPYDPLEEAFKDAVDAVFYRHVLPERIWKLQKWLGMGKEKKHAQAWETLDQFLYSTIMKRLQEDEVRKRKEKDGDDEEEEAENFSIFAAFQQLISPSSSSLQFLRDAFTSLLFAGRDTTSAALTWLFWLLAQHPAALAKVRDEITRAGLFRGVQDDLLAKCRGDDKLVFLHAALCETLRLYPPVPLNHKVPAETDRLPSGHRVGPGTSVILSFYSMGRREEIWGDDCMEFKPERWILDGGRTVKHVPSYKFPAFNAGPRTCVGKDMSWVVMKMVAATVIHRYCFQLQEDHPVIPKDSVVLKAKHGLKVKLSFIPHNK